MHWLFGAFEELLPVLIFFVAQEFFSFSIGVGAMVVTLIGLMGMAYALRRPVPQFALISTLALLIFAIPTMVTGDTNYFQISDTVLGGFFALLLLGCWVFRYPILKVFFGRIFAITDRAWHILSLRWGLLFLVLATTNEYIRLTYSIDVWSAYKLFSSIGILLFGCYQFTLSARERIKNESNWLGLRS